jgi:hypothetical protein
MTHVPADTTPEAAWVQMQIYSRMSGEARLLQALEMSDAIRALTATGVRRQYPEYTEEQVRLTVIRRMLGDELFRKAYPNASL